MGYLGLLFALVVCLELARHARWSWKTRAQRERRGRYRGGAALGNALHTLQAFVQPRPEHVIEELLEERADEDDESAPKDPAAHLLRQAKRIQKGEKIERLTALFPE